MKIRKREWKERVQMKKVICLIISVLSIFVFVSCGSGVSVPYRTVQLANRYSEVNYMLEEYENGYISYEDFVNGIQEFRNTNAEYLEHKY